MPDKDPRLMSYEEALAAGWRPVPPNQWQRVLTARTEAGLSIEELSEASGLGVRTLRNWEAARSIPYGKKLRQLMAATGKPEDFFMDCNYTQPGWNNDACWPPKVGDKPTLTLIQGGLD